MTFRRCKPLVCLAVAPALAASIVSCRSSTDANAGAVQPQPMAAASPDRPSIEDARPADLDGLHNVVAFHDGFYSGSVPEGEAGFRSLERLGVKTIISVDGAAPDVEAARARGMRYIHLPIGYDGIDHEQKLRLARAARDAMAQGPVYVHCHHGKHRSAAAAGTIAATLGWASSEAMIERMRVSGTSPNYAGLYACTSTAVALPADLIDRVPADFPSVSMPRGIVKAMVEADHAWEHLKQIRDAGWRAPASHPDLVPAAEAGRLAEVFRLLAEDESIQDRPAEFHDLLQTAWEAAQSLEDLLAAGSTDAEALSAPFQRIGTTCGDCHRAYRD